MGIANSGSSSFLFSCGAQLPTTNHVPQLSASFSHRMPQTLHSKHYSGIHSRTFPINDVGPCLPSFPHTLISLGPFANQGCKIVFDKTSVTVYHPDGHLILNGWWDINGPQLWQFPLTAPPPLPVYLPPSALLAGGLSAAMAAGLPHPSQGFWATSAAREDIQVEFLQEATQSMAMAAHASSTPYNP